MEERMKWKKEKDKLGMEEQKVRKEANGGEKGKSELRKEGQKVKEEQEIKKE